MLYIIGGPPRCGKTTLARKLAKKLKVTWFSSDMFEGFTGGFFNDRKEYAKRFPKNIIRDLTHNVNDEMYSQYSTKEIMDTYIVQGKIANHMTEVLVEEMIKEKQDLIIEGYHLFPSLVSMISNKYGKENFRVIYLLKDNYKNTFEGLMASNLEDDWVHNKTKDKAIIKNIAQFIFEFSEYYKSEADKFGFSYVEYSGNLDEYLNQAERVLLK